MKEIKSFEFKPSANAIQKKYDWAKLLDGKLYELAEGEDFTCTQQTIVMMARKQAAKRGRALQIQKVEGGVVLKAGAVGSGPIKDEPEETAVQPDQPKPAEQPVKPVEQPKQQPTGKKGRK